MWIVNLCASFILMLFGSKFYRSKSRCVYMYSESELSPRGIVGNAGKQDFEFYSYVINISITP